MIVIFVFFDGSNLITIITEDGEKIAQEVKLKAIKQYSRHLKKEISSVNPIIFVDSPIFHYIDNETWLRSQINSWEIFKCDNGHEADEYLLGFLKILPFQVLIVSQDKFRDHKGKIPKYYEGFEWRFRPKFQGKRLRIPGLKGQIRNMIVKKSCTNLADFDLGITDENFISEVL